jgi:hypothetical protein
MAKKAMIRASSPLRARGASSDDFVMKMARRIDLLIRRCRRPMMKDEDVSRLLYSRECQT